MYNGMIPFVAFWVILAVGLYLQELSVKGAVIFVVVYFAGIFGVSLLSDHSVFQLAPVVVVDAILILKIFGGDVKIR